jgi:Condensation domain
MFTTTLEDCGAYVAQVIWKLDTIVTAPRMIEAWQVLLENHDILRTRFVQTSEGPHQVVYESSKAPFRSFVGSLQDALQGGLNIGFREPDESWIDFTVVKDAETEYFVLKIHHCLYDGWTFGLYLKQLDQYLSGDAVAMKSSFKPFVQKVLNTDGEATKMFWVQYLSDASPSNLAMNQVGGDGTGKIHHDLDVDFSTIQNAADEASVTVSTLLKTAWGLALQVFCQSEDVTFGEVVSGRDVQLKGIERYGYNSQC